MMAYPFLCGIIESLLRNLVSSPLSEFEIKPNLKIGDLKDSLTFLLERIQANQFPDHLLNEIKGSIYELYDLLDGSIAYREDNWVEEVRRRVMYLYDRLLPPLSPASSQVKLAGLYPKGKEIDQGLHSFLSPKSPKLSPAAEVEWPNNVELPSHLTPCFRYCCLYPKGHRIVRETVVNQWMAEGFLFPTQETGAAADEELEDIGSRYFDELLSKGLLEEPMFVFDSGNNQQQVVYSAQMHQLAHDVAGVGTVNKEEVVVVDGHESVPQGVTHLVFNKDKITDFRLDLVELGYSVRTCLFFGTTPVPRLQHSFIISSLRMLRVLDLSGSQFELIPFSIVMYSEQLRYLGLSRNRRIKSFERPMHGLNKLQTLAADGCTQLEELPFWGSTLRHLYLTWKQKTLQLFSSPSLCILELSHCKELRSIIPGKVFLRKLRISDCPRLVSLPDSVDFFSRIEELVFHNCYRLDLGSGLGMNGLQSLKYLEITSLPKLVELPAGLQSATALRYFMIANCKSLDIITDVVYHLQSLQKFCIYDCRRLRALPERIQGLPSLQLLDIRECPNLVERCTVNSGTVISHVPKVILQQEALQNQVDQNPESSRTNKCYTVADNRMLKWLEEKDAQLSAVAQTESYVDQSVPYFTLKSLTLQADAGTFCEEYECKAFSQWDFVALAIRAIHMMKAMVKETYQRCGLHCCLFPNDYEFERDTLIQLWMAESLIKNKHMEDYGNRYFNFLLDGKYVLFSRTDNLTGKEMYKANLEKVTTLLNGIPNIKEDLYTTLETEETVGTLKPTETTTDRFMKAWHVSLVSNHIDQATFETLKRFNKLRTLMFIRNYGSSLNQVPSGIFLALTSLHALDLSGSHITQLPSSIRNLKELRFLDLSFTLIEKFPKSVDRLHELQTLKLKGCEHLFGLPEGLTKLSKLRHLDFDVLGQLTSMPRGIGALNELRTLPAFIVDKDSNYGCNIRELGFLVKLSGSCCISGLENATGEDAKKALMIDKTSLTQLQLRWKENNLDTTSCYRASSTIEHLQPSSCLKELQIICYPGFELPEWISTSRYWKLVSISLLKCENRRLNISLGQLPELKYIDIIEMNEVKTIDYSSFRGGDNMNCVAFPKLEKLTIDGMFKLEFWTGMWAGAHSGDFPLLSELRIRHCPKLSAIPFVPWLCSLKHLEISYCKELQSFAYVRLSTSLDTLVIYKCPLMKKRCSKGGQDWDNIKHVPNIWVDLKKMSSTEEVSVENENNQTSDDDSDSSEDSD